MSQRDSFHIGDYVRFNFHGVAMRGVINRTNPKRAVVAADSGEDYHVPYALLYKENGGTTPPNSARRRSAEEMSRFADMTVAAMKEHGLTGWTFRFDNAARRAGCCNYTHKVISLSRSFTQVADEAEIKETILHEIAHALVGGEHGHDAVWQKKARELGCSGKRCHDIQFSPPRLIMSCAAGCWAVKTHRRRRAICKKCGGALHFQAFTPARWAAMENAVANAQAGKGRSEKLSRDASLRLHQG